MTDEQFVAVARHYLGADLTASIASAQMDIADVIDARSVDYDDEEPTKPAKKTARRKGKVAVSLVENEPEPN